MAKLNMNLLVLMMVWIHEVSLDVCPRRWHQWMGSCYYILDGKMEWATAYKACRRPGSHLVITDSEDENNLIRGLLENYKDAIPTSKVWIGCNDLSQYGSWECFGEESKAPNYTNWSGNEPTQSRDQRCVRLHVNAGNWGNQNCLGLLFAMCELRYTEPVYCLPMGADGHLQSQCLIGHTISSLAVQGVTQCGKACWAKPRCCYSFNILMLEGGKHICQLNNATRGEVSGDTTNSSMGNCYYFDL